MRGSGNAGDLIRVLLVEDHPRVREAVAAEHEPDFEVVADGESEGASAAQAASLADARHHVGSMHHLTEIARAIERGASAVLNKVTDLGQIAQAVRDVLTGERRPRTEESISG
jgi:DNA-binding NarL/FixJ family response regulator